MYGSVIKTIWFCTKYRSLFEEVILFLTYMYDSTGNIW